MVHEGHLAIPPASDAKMNILFLRGEKLAQFLADNFNTESMTVIDESRICTRALLTSMLTQYAYDNHRRDPEAELQSREIERK